MSKGKPIRTRPKAVLQNIALVFASLALCFIAIEAGYRIIDPYPYFSPWESNVSEHSNLLQYDPRLGWRGMPNAQEFFVTGNARVWLEHNRHGFRDIQPEQRAPDKPAVVFLGDSFTWGYEVEYEDMFVNRIREKLERYEVFNLAHRGYGTDQALLTFQQWHHDGGLAWVMLMFSENDFDDNNRALRYEKPKPKFEVAGDSLVLTNVPVPRSEHWKTAGYADASRGRTLTLLIKHVLLQSHFLHDVHARLRYRSQNEQAFLSLYKNEPPDRVLTARLLKELRDEVERRGGRFMVVAIPSKAQFLSEHVVPYQQYLETICKTEEIAYLDLADALDAAVFRTYFRDGMHLNKYGHQVVAEAVYRHVPWSQAGSR